ncbi:metallophosphoesterase [Halobacteriovorax sp. GB3]|uniref:metallophosphoesterase n=1 Tax=Halobacteriovorax sp. GB3 TaxID=2719615 RepID=UPI00236316D2|nr:metallophosphoesterase [Halobacteriovorax sp. GB3]MDD0853498.1 metallophosphoesterase [Halobacteriovorax sp. GB3]
MLYLILSDLHLGKGRFLKNGQLNILEDFFEDERLLEFCEYYSSGKFYLKPVHLILNGDILNLIQIDHQGVFTHIIDENHTINALKSIHKGHRKFFKSLQNFLKAPNKKVTYVIGNHDAAMAFDGAQECFNELVGAPVEFCHEYVNHGLHVEHGHRFEAINTVPKKDFFIKGPFGKEILNLPWGSLFCISVLPVLKKKRPYIDKVRPMSSYVKWCFFHDFGFFMTMLKTVARYLITTNSDNYIKQNRNFKTTLRILKQITIYPRYEKQAKRILKRNPRLHSVVMGHTHLQEWRRFPEGKYYFNTGTWNTIPSIDAGSHMNETKLSYCMIEVHTKSETLINGSLNLWKGKWKPFISEIATS